MKQYLQPEFKILVACHKPVELLKKEPPYMPIHVGKQLHPEIDLGIIADNAGDNISEKNISFCELTALYWAWKNLKNIDYIGLCHYRRYFGFNKNNSEKEEIERLLRKYDILMPKKEYAPATVYEHYINSHHKKDILNIYQILKKQGATKEFLTAFEKTMNQNRYYRYNMFIMPWKLFDEYCNIIFPALFELEKITDISQYDDYQKRVFGFLAERLTTVYINSISSRNKIKELKVINTETKPSGSIFHYTPLSKRNRQYLLSKHIKFPKDEITTK